MAHPPPPSHDVRKPHKRSAARRLIGRVFRIHVFPLLLSVLVRLYGLTLRLEKRHEDRLADYRQSSRAQGEGDGENGPGDREPGRGGGIIFALWHGPHFPVLYAARDRGVYVTASRSADGEMLARVLHRFGYRTVRGSSGHGGTRALIDLARIVKTGADAALAVDGPRGPIYQVKPGVILLAKLTGAPIVPLTGSVTRDKKFHSWDRFRLPYPFSRAVVEVGQALYVPSDADGTMIESKRVELENLLNANQTRLDAELKSS